MPNLYVHAPIMASVRIIVEKAAGAASQLCGSERRRTNEERDAPFIVYLRRLPLRSSAPSISLPGSAMAQATHQKYQPR